MDAPVVILLAEDDALIGSTFLDVLEDGGFNVLWAQSGTEAIAALDTKQPFSGLITDICLGSGPDGWEVARHARELMPDLPVVYMSGDSAHEHGSRGLPDSVMLQKPFAGAQLVTAIATLINSAILTS